MSNTGILLGLGFNALARILETVLCTIGKRMRGEGLNGMLELCPQEGRLRQEDILGRIHDMRPESPPVDCSVRESAGPSTCQGDRSGDEHQHH